MGADGRVALVNVMTLPPMKNLAQTAGKVINAAFNLASKMSPHANQTFWNNFNDGLEIQFADDEAGSATPTHNNSSFWGDKSHSTSAHTPCAESTHNAAPNADIEFQLKTIKSACEANGRALMLIERVWMGAGIVSHY